jgi:hypothetical protein
VSSIGVLLLQLLRYAPCEHNVCHAQNAKIPTHRLFHPRHTVARWRLQYDLGGTFTVPSPAERQFHMSCSPALEVVPEVFFKDLFDAPNKKNDGGSGGGGGGGTKKTEDGGGGGGGGGGNRNGKKPGPKRKKRFKAADELKRGKPKRNRKEAAASKLK